MIEEYDCYFFMADLHTITVRKYSTMAGSENSLLHGLEVPMNISLRTRTEETAAVYFEKTRDRDVL